MSSLAKCLHRRLLVAVALLVVLSGVAGVPWSASASPGWPPSPSLAFASAAQPDAACPDPAVSPVDRDDPASPLYDYAVLVDVSGSMVGALADGSVDPSRDIFATVKESIKEYVGELQPGSLVHIIPFGNPVDPLRVRTFGIENPDAPDGDGAAALAYIDSLPADNIETHITSSVQYALDLLDGMRAGDDREHIQTILLYTDGIGNGPEDLDANGNFSLANLAAVLGEYTQEQPYLFVKYVSLGVEVPNRVDLVEIGVDVVETARGGAPVREVRLSVAPPDLGTLAPGAPATNLLCASSGDLGDGISVVVNDDPADLPDDVQVAFRAGGSVLTEDGLPLTYTLANLPDSGSGPFTTHVEVRSDDPEIFFIPSRLPVTFGAARAAPTVELEFGESTQPTIVRGEEAPVEWTAPIDASFPEGGEIGLRIDRLRLDEILPNATLGLRVGAGPLRDSVSLDGNQAGLELVLSAPASDLATLPDGESQIPVDLVVAPRETDLSITGAGAVRNDDGTYAVSLAAPLTIQPQPECTVEVADLPGQTVTEGDASGGPVRWDGSIDLGGSDGCAAEVVIDDSTLRQAMPGARASLVVDGEERTRTVAADEPVRVDLVVTAPRAAVTGLGAGDHDTAVDLVVDPGVAAFAPPPGATSNDVGTFTIAVPVRVTVAERPVVRCKIPGLAEQQVVLDGANDPSLEWTGQIACDMSEGTSVTITATGGEASAAFVAEDGTESRSITLAAGDSAQSGTVAVRADRREAQRLGEGRHDVSAEVRFRASPDGAILDVPGGTTNPDGTVTAPIAAPIEVIPECVIALPAIAFAPDLLAITTRDTGPDPLVWRGVIAADLRNCAQGTLAIDAEALPDGVSASFEVGGTVVPSPAALAEQQAPIALVVEMTMTAAQALGPNEDEGHAIRIPVVLDSQGARVDAPGAARQGDRYTLNPEARLAITTPPSAALSIQKIEGQTVSTVPDGSDDVTFVAPVDYELSDGAVVTVVLDDADLRRDFPGAEAELLVDGEPAGSSIGLADDKQRVDVAITAPKSAFPEAGAFDLPIALVAEGEGVFISIDGVDIAPGDEARAEASAPLTVSVPAVTIDPGAWSPELLEVESTGTGADPRRWERVITADGLDGDARPAVTLALDGDSPLAESATVRLYAGSVAEENLLAEGGASRPATVTFAPDQETIVAVIEAGEDRLRALGLSDAHTLGGTLTLDPNGAQAMIAGQDEPARNPTDEDFSVKARVYEPFDLWSLIRNVGLGLLALLAAAAVFLLWPGLPADAAVSIDGTPVSLPRGGGLIGGPGSLVVVGNGPVGEIKGRFGGRLTGAAKFVAAAPVTILGQDVEAGKSENITPDTRIDPEDGSPFEYVRNKIDSVTDDASGGFGEGAIG